MATIDIESLKEGVISRDLRRLGRAITLVESVHPDHQEPARMLVDRLLPHAGRAIRLGISGVPGVGKSTFIERLGLALIGLQHRVAVLAVDPSSVRSGGSILGDKTRMEQLACHPMAFIRPSPAGRTLGGVTARTRETMIVCEAAGFDVVIVETVGVGQSETAVASMVDFFLLLMLAGAGDELQGIKRGIMEMADAVVITKADGDTIAQAEKARQDYENALHYLAPESPFWTPVVHTVSALENRGVGDVWDTVLRHHHALAAHDALTAKRRKQTLAWLNQMIESELHRRFHTDPRIQTLLPTIMHDVEQGTLSPASAVSKLFSV
jgi:LAO/AO transport system kinase